MENNDLNKINDLLLDNSNINIDNLQNDSYNCPDACKGCSNHPSNGGSGICHCTLGLVNITS